MLLEAKVSKRGRSLVCALPEEVVKALDVKDGDTLCLHRAADGSFRLRAADPEFSKQMEIAEKAIRRYRNTLRELSK